MFRYISSFLFSSFVVVPTVQSVASTCSDLEYKLSKVLFHCYFGQSYPLEKIAEPWQHVGFIQQWLKVRQLKKKLTTGYHAMFSSVTRFQPWYFHLLCVRLIEKKRTAFFFEELRFNLFSQVQDNVLFLEIYHILRRFFNISVLDTMFHKGVPITRFQWNK